MATVFWIAIFLLTVLAIIAWFVISLILVIRTPKEKVGLKIAFIIMLVLSSITLILTLAIVTFIIALLSGAIPLM